MATITADSATEVGVRINGAPDPRLTATTMFLSGATATDTHPDTGAPDGGSYFRRTIHTANTGSPMTMNLSAGTDSSIPVIAGESYTGSWYAKKSTGTINTYMAVTWFSSVGSIITGNTGSNNLPTTTWTRYSQTWEAPEHAAFAQPSIRWSGTAMSGQTLDFAQAQWEKTPTLLDYFDGDYVDSVWSGTPNASSSVTDISNIVRHTPALVYDYSHTRTAASVVHETLLSGYPYTSLRAPQSRSGTFSTIWDSRAKAFAAEAALMVPERFQLDAPEEDLNFFFVVDGDLTLEAVPGTDYWIIRIGFREVSP